MTRLTIPMKLLNFLDNVGALDYYINEISNALRISSNSLISDIFTNYDNYNISIYGYLNLFPWDKSIKGSSYWINIYNKVRNYEGENG